MTQSGSRGWSRYVLEALTIVFSVLFALAIDALWDYRLDRVAEREYLAGLRDEFEASAVELESDKLEREKILRRTEALLARTRGVGDVPADSLGPWTASALNYRFFTPVHSVLDDLMSSGNLKLIRSRALRRALLDYEQERQRLAVIEQRERDFLAEQLEPHLARSLPLDDYLTLDVFDNDPVLEPPPAVAPYRRLLDDPTTASLLHLRWERSEGARAFARNVERSIQRVRTLLPNDAIP